MNMVKVAVLAAVVLLLLGCRATVGDPIPADSTKASSEPPHAAVVAGTPGSASVAGNLVEFRPSRPANVTTEINSQSSAAQIIGPSGGTIEAKGFDGTMYVLAFPADAVLLDTLITVTPIVSATGGPLAAGSTAYGVRIEPDDAQLFGVATLEITPAVSIGAVAAFSSESGGENVHFDLIDLRTDTLLLPITHFSDHFVLEVGQITEVKPEPAPAEGAVEVTVGEITEVKPEPAPAEGAVEVTVGEITEVKPEPAPAEGAVSGGSGTSTTASWTPEGAGEQLANEVGKLLADERERQQRGEPPDPELFDDLLSLSDEFYTRLIEPYVDQWPTNCFVAKLTVPLALSWARQRQLLGIDDDVRYDHVWAQMVLGLENCVRELIDPCLQPKDVSEFFGYIRQLELLGGEHAYSDLDFEDVLCGEIYGRVTKTVTWTSDDDLGSVRISNDRKETFEVWVSHQNPFLTRDDTNPQAETIVFVIVDHLESIEDIEVESACYGSVSTRRFMWNGSEVFQGPTIGFFDGTVGIHAFGEMAALVTSNNYTQRTPESGEGSYCAYEAGSYTENPQMWFFSESSGTLSEDRTEIYFDTTETVGGETTRITGTLRSKTPLPDF